ncbi:hypothetical protein Cgig2_021121 [Carnegiea gigantea]|uniref:Uncharacterized protein n=1 Tax=Carnegiea gigantea TaxID=171969 RepID=A0A9Q1JFJ6_9CARY|nr:hypothetical protein Cgig2_021121 [Carnegiea gigantea]
MYAAKCHEKDDQTRGVTKKVKSATHVTLQPLSKMDEKNTQQPLISIGSGISNGKDQGSNHGKDQGSGNDKGKSTTIMKPTVLLSANNALSHTQMETTVNNNTPNGNEAYEETLESLRDHDHVVCFGYGVTPKDVWGLQPSKVDLMAEIQEKNEQTNALTGCVDALESNHQKKIEEMKTAHEVHMAEMKESHQQDMAKIEGAHHKGMATIVECSTQQSSSVITSKKDVIGKAIFMGNYDHDGIEELEKSVTLKMKIFLINQWVRKKAETCKHGDS